MAIFQTKLTKAIAQVDAFVLAITAGIEENKTSIEALEETIKTATNTKAQLDAQAEVASKLISKIQG